MDERKPPRVALVWRGDAEARRASSFGRFLAVASALNSAGMAAEACVYDEAVAEDVRAQLLACDAALVWVNPIQDGVRRGDLDELLEAVAGSGVLVSARPDVIRKIGVKAVLSRTRRLGWSGGARLYDTPHTLMMQFPDTVAEGPRVLKQNRGNGGIGVWKVSAVGEGRVEVQEAAGGGASRLQPLVEFLEDRLGEFDAAGGYVDQAFQPRHLEGMIRCYMSGGRVAGFGHQMVRALAPPEAGPAGPRLYSGPSDPRFQDLGALMETVWTPDLCDLLDIDPDDLPLIWDADFLYGPPTPDGADTFVLCEINASSVSPMPEEAPAAIAATLAGRLAARRRGAG